MDVKINYTWDCTQFTFLDMLRIMKTFHYQVVTILYMYNLLLTLPWLFMLLMIIFQFEVFLNKKKTFLVCNQFFLKHSILIQFNMTLKKSSTFMQTIATKCCYLNGIEYFERWINIQFKRAIHSRQNVDIS